MRINKRRQNNHNTLLIFGSFFFIGLVFIVVGLCVWRADATFFKTAISTSAEIVDIQSHRDYDGNRSHEVFVSYTVDGTSYDYMRINKYSSDMYIGKLIEVYYNPTDPGKVKTKSGSIILVVIFLVLGSVFAIIGGCILLGQIKVRKKCKLKDTGSCIRLPITQIITTNVTVNGVPGHVVICGNSDGFDGEQSIYRSDPCYRRIKDYMKSGDLVAVYYDPADPSKYFVDINDVQQMERNLKS